jgi:hypothetical protein
MKIHNTSVKYSLNMKSIELVPKIQYDRDRKLNQILNEGRTN